MKNRIFFLALWLLLSLKVSAQTGDICSDAYSITLDDPDLSPCSFKQISALDFDDFNNDAGVPNPGCSYGTNNYDFWVKVTLPMNSDGLKITIDSTIATDNDYRNFVAATYTGPDCSNLSYHNCKTTSRKTVYNNFFDGFNPGDEVYVRIYRKNSPSDTWNLPFFLRFTAINTLNSEDACGNARALSLGTYCNYTSTDKNESDNNAPDKLTGTDLVCQPNSLAFGSFDNNQWYFFEVTASTSQPVQIVINNVSCTAGDQILQAAIWKTSAYNCANWANGYDMTDPVAADDGDLIACAVGTGTVNITKNLPPGKYWYTLDGSAGAFCKYDIITSLNPPLPLLFLNCSIVENIIRWNSLDDRNVMYYIIQYSDDGIHFQNSDTLRALMYHGVLLYEQDLSATSPYYRMAALLFNSELHFSPVINRRFHSMEDNVHTETSDENIVFKIRDYNGQLRYSLFESTGKEILSGNIKSYNGETIRLAASPVGLTLLWIETEKEMILKKVVSNQ